MNLPSLRHLNRIGLRQVVDTLIGGSGSSSSGEKKEEGDEGEGMCD